MIVLCSGGFDPLHIGHLRYLRAAASFGAVTVALNSDAWLIAKKGYVFIPWRDRQLILEALSCVARVTAVEDEDGTVCEALRRIGPHYFANGGDRKHPHLAEYMLCQKLGIGELFNVGGGKIASSSALIKAAHDHHANALQD